MVHEPFPYLAESVSPLDWAACRVAQAGCWRLSAAWVLVDLPAVGYLPA